MGGVIWRKTLLYNKNFLSPSIWYRKSLKIIKSRLLKIRTKIMGNIYTCGPNTALVVSGGCFGGSAKKTVVGGWAWAWWFVTDVQKMSLGVMTLNPRCEKVETAKGVPLTVTGVAQVKIMKSPELLHTASEQFLGKRKIEIEDTILQTLEGHLRAILGTMTVEEIYRDREQFALKVREVASPDVGKMGIEILSFTIKDVFDNVNYLGSLGKTQTEVVKRDAKIGIAEANRDAGIKEVNTAKAEAELAYKLEEAKLQQNIRTEQIKVQVVERKKQIEIEEQEIKRKEKELSATVKLPAEAHAYKTQIIAEGQRTQVIEAAKAEAESVRLIGAAEATSIEAVGKAEAEAMKLKAKAYSQYGEAAIMSLIVEAMPKIAAEVAAPLGKTEEIVLLGGADRTTNEINKLLGQLPPAVQALTGVDLSGALAKIPGATVKAN